MEKSSRLAQVERKSDASSRNVFDEYDFIEKHDQAFSFAYLLGKEQISFIQDELDHDLENLFLDLIDIIDLSQSASRLLDMAAMHEYRLSLSFVEHGGYELDIEAKQLIIDNFGLSLEMLVSSEYYKNQLIINLLRGLRDIWHQSRISDIYEFLNPENIIKIERFRAADIEAITTHILWQLRNEGYGELWRSLLTDEDGDIALSYMNLAEDQADHMGQAAALQKAFRQWFTDPARSDACDHDALEIMDGMGLEKGFIRAFGKHVLNAEQLVGLMILPNGLRYLEDLKDQMLTDPFYSGFNDVINQAHLLHIMQDCSGYEQAGVRFQDSSLAAMIFPKRDSLL